MRYADLPKLLSQTLNAAPHLIHMHWERNHDGTRSLVPNPPLDVFGRKVCDWYLLTEMEWNSLSADAQHRMIDRYCETQNLLADRKVEETIKQHNAMHAVMIANSKIMQKILNAGPKPKRTRKAKTPTKAKE